MKELTVAALEGYLYELYGAKGREQGLFMKLVEEMGEVAELLNIRAGSKPGDDTTDEALARELADVIHYAVAIAAVNRIDLAKTIVEKDKKAAVKYHHEMDLETYLNR